MRPDNELLPAAMAALEAEELSRGAMPRPPRDDDAEALEYGERAESATRFVA